MKAWDLFKKQQSGEKLTDEETVELKKFAETFDPDSLANDRAAKARKETEGKLQAVLEEKATLEKKIHELEEADAASKMAGKSDLEKATIRLEKMQKQLTELETRAKQAEADRSSLQRAVGVDKVFGKLRFISGVDADGMRALLDRHLGEIDLNDEELVNGKVEQFVLKNKALIQAEAPGGTGSQNAGGGGNLPKQVDAQALLNLALTGDVKTAEMALSAAKRAVAAGATMK